MQLKLDDEIVIGICRMGCCKLDKFGVGKGGGCCWKDDDVYELEKKFRVKVVKVVFVFIKMEKIQQWFVEVFQVKFKLKFVVDKILLDVEVGGGIFDDDFVFLGKKVMFINIKVKEELEVFIVINGCIKCVVVVKFKYVVLDDLDEDFMDLGKFLVDEDVDMVLEFEEVVVEKLFVKCVVVVVVKVKLLYKFSDNELDEEVEEKLFVKCVVVVKVKLFYKFSDDDFEDDFEVKLLVKCVVVVKVKLMYKFSDDLDSDDSLKFGDVGVMVKGIGVLVLSSSGGRFSLFVMFYFGGGDILVFFKMKFKLFKFSFDLDDYDDINYEVFVRLFFLKIKEDNLDDFLLDDDVFVVKFVFKVVFKVKVFFSVVLVLVKKCGCFVGSKSIKDKDEVIVFKVKVVVIKIVKIVVVKFKVLYFLLVVKVYVVKKVKV